MAASLIAAQKCPICKKFFDSMTSQEIELPGRKDSYSITYWNETEVCNEKLNQ